MLFHVSGEMLDANEGVPNRYPRASVTLKQADGSQVEAVTYRAGRPQSEFSEPSDHNLQVICQVVPRWSTRLKSSQNNDFREGKTAGCEPDVDYLRLEDQQAATRQAP